MEIQKLVIYLFLIPRTNGDFVIESFEVPDSVTNIGDQNAVFEHFNLWQRIDLYPYPDQTDGGTDSGGGGDDGTNTGGNDSGDSTDTGEGDTDSTDDDKKEFTDPSDPRGSPFKATTESTVGIVYDNITSPTIDQTVYVPYDNPVKDHAIINLFSREHDGELCMRDVDQPFDDKALTSNGQVAYPLTKNNLTSWHDQYSGIPVQSNFEYTQWRTDPNLDNYDVQYYVKDPKIDPLSNLMLRDRKTFRGVIESYNGSYTHQSYQERRDRFKPSQAKVDGFHHYEAQKEMYERYQTCNYALRLTRSEYNSSSFVSYRSKQNIMYGWQLDFTFQTLFISQECKNYQCRNNFGQGFAVVIHNRDQENLTYSNLTSGNGLGYKGLPGGALVIEFDYHNDTDLFEPSYPHLSVQYTPKTGIDEFNQIQSTHFNYSLAHKHLMKDLLSDEQIHNVRIVYDPDTSQLNFKERPLTRSKYLNLLLMQKQKTEDPSVAIPCATELLDENICFCEVGFTIWYGATNSKGGIDLNYKFPNTTKGHTSKRSQQQLTVCEAASFPEGDPLPPQELSCWCNDVFCAQEGDNCLCEVGLGNNLYIGLANETAGLDTNVPFHEKISYPKFYCDDDTFANSANLPFGDKFCWCDQVRCASQGEWCDCQSGSGKGQTKKVYYGLADDKTGALDTDRLYDQIDATYQHYQADVNFTVCQSSSFSGGDPLYPRSDKKCFCQSDLQNELWTTQYENGILHIYIDDMKTPYLSTIVNLGEMVDTDRMYTADQVSKERGDDPLLYDGQMAGHAYISFSAATQNRKGRVSLNSSVNTNIGQQLRDDTGNVTTDLAKRILNTDDDSREILNYTKADDFYYIPNNTRNWWVIGSQKLESGEQKQEWWRNQEQTFDDKATFQNYGSLQILRWKFLEWPKCPLPRIRCSITSDRIKDQSSPGFTSFKLRNIHNKHNSTEGLQDLEQFYIKFIFTSSQFEWRDCRESIDWDPINYAVNQNDIWMDRFYEHKILPSMFHGIWDGCQIEIQFDETVYDIIIHDRQNKTHISVKDTFNGRLRNELYVVGQELCVKKLDGVMQLANCDCTKCVEIFDDQRKYAYAKREWCQKLNLTRGPSCKCFETSEVNLSQEQSIRYQDHKVCTECKYHSHCRYMNKDSFCADDGNTNPDGSIYRIGNPINGTIATAFDPKDWLRDGNRVTNGSIQSDSCICDIADYDDNTYTVYRTDLMDEAQRFNCNACFHNQTYHTEEECQLAPHSCGPGTEIHYLTKSHGYSCAQCILAGEEFQVLPQNEKDIVVSCVQEAKKLNTDIYKICKQSQYTVSMEYSRIFSGQMTHMLAECPSKPFNLSMIYLDPVPEADWVQNPSHGGAVCMPYFGYRGIQGLNKYNGATVKLEFDGNCDQDDAEYYLWTEGVQCMDNNCEMRSKSECNADPSLQPCVCYDTCPLGQTLYPTYDKYEMPPNQAKRTIYNLKQVQAPEITWMVFQQDTIIDSGYGQDNHFVWITNPLCYGDTFQWNSKAKEKIKLTAVYDTDGKLISFDVGNSMYNIDAQNFITVNIDYDTSDPTKINGIYGPYNEYYTAHDKSDFNFCYTNNTICAPPSQNWKPCSGRGACRHDGTCICLPGYTGDNCFLHESEVDPLELFPTIYQP